MWLDQIILSSSYGDWFRTRTARLPDINRYMDSANNYLMYTLQTCLHKKIHIHRYISTVQLLPVILVEGSCLPPLIRSHG